MFQTSFAQTNKQTNKQASKQASKQANSTKGIHDSFANHARPRRRLVEREGFPDQIPDLQMNEYKKDWNHQPGYKQFSKPEGFSFHFSLSLPSGVGVPSSQDDANFYSIYIFIL